MSADPFDAIDQTLAEMADAVNPLLECLGCEPIKTEDAQ
jgi:hypothetical protein